MKKYLLIIILSVNIQCVEENSGQNSNITELIKYTDKQNEFSLEYPKKWKKISNMNSVCNLFVAEEYKDSNDLFREGFNVKLLDNVNKSSLEQICDENVRHINKMYKNSNLEKLKLVNKNHLNHFIIKFEIEKSDLKLISFTSIFLDEDKIFIISQTAEKQKINSYQSVFQNIINSFNVLH